MELERCNHGAQAHQASLLCLLTMRLRHDQFAGSNAVRENIAKARATGYAATSPQGLTALERAYYFRKLELEQC